MFVDETPLSRAELDLLLALSCIERVGTIYYQLTPYGKKFLT